MNKRTKVMSFVLAGLMAASTLAGCSNTEATQSKADVAASTATTSTATAPIKLRFTSPQKASDPAVQKTIEYAKSLNVDLEFEEIASDKYLDKISTVLLANNATFDFFYETQPNVANYVDANVIMPIDDLAKDAGIDLEKTFGSSSQKLNGKSYQLPNTKDVWMTLYNKKIFDDAGVPYPTAEGWTWEKYLETAKKLSNPVKGIYGSFMNEDWDTFRILSTQQKGVSVYKEDGTTNFEDPAFAQSFKFLKDLSDDKSQISYMNFVSKKTAWDSFATGKFGMTVNGGWSIDFVSKQTDYPRDWQFGILPMPSVDSANPSTLSIVGGYFIPSNCKNPKAAFMVAEKLAENEYTFNPARLPTKVGLTKDDTLKYIDSTFIPSFKKGEVKAEDVYNTWFNPNIKLMPEKFIGKNCSELSKMVIDEVDPYLLGKKTLEETVKTLKQKGDASLKNAD